MTRDVKRIYDSARRQARSAETRQRIVNAARELIMEVGYRATTIAAVAARAAVNVDTVYELVGRKPVLLRQERYQFLLAERQSKLNLSTSLSCRFR